MKLNFYPQFIGADVFALSIALAVFATLTVFLLAFVILLFASGKFRSVFFGNDKSAKRKSTKKTDKKPEPSEPMTERSSSESEMPSEPQQKQSSSRRKRSNDPVPTVPIDFPFTPATKQQSRRNEPTYANTFEREPTTKKARSTTNTYDHVPTVFIPRTTTKPTGTPVTSAKRIAPKKTAATADSAETTIPATVKTVPLVSASATKKTTRTATATTQKATEKKPAKSSGAAPKTKKR